MSKYPPSDHQSRPEVVIAGAGFAGLACAAGLGDTGLNVTVVDRRNHNLFQPLLYQVATAALSPADIAEPVRRTLGRYENIRVMLGEIVRIDSSAQQIFLRDGAALPYDELVIATGSEYNYFGNEQWKPFAPGLKTIHEARLIRHRLLSAFEQAERESNPAARKRLLTFAIIGGGPTGVEMAGAISELARYMIHRDFRTIGKDEFEVLLIEAGPRILAAFPEKLAAYAHQYLTALGIRVLTGQRVTALDAQSISLGEQRIDTSCIVWGAGVRASPAASWLGIEGGLHGRIAVEPDLSLRGHANISVIGDTALALDEKGAPLPALGQVAKQQGTYLARRLRRKLAGKTEAAPFRFRNRGNTAVIGRNAAIFDFGSWTMKGRMAWLLWALVHVYLLINFEKRLLVSIQWVSRYFTKQRGARLIDEDHTRTRKEEAAPEEPVVRESAGASS
jgi:NADH dehydrogenase